MVFLIDASQGVGAKIYEKEKELVKSLANHFNLFPTGPRGSAVNYAENPRTVARFVDTDFHGKVDGATLLGSPRRIDRALEHAAQILANSTRKRRKIVILLTAGRQATGAKPFNEAVKPLRDLGAQTFVVAVGSKPDIRELYSVVQNPRDIFNVPREDELLHQSQSISRKIRDKPSKNVSSTQGNSAISVCLRVLYLTCVCATN